MYFVYMLRCRGGSLYTGIVMCCIKTAIFSHNAVNHISYSLCI